MYLASNLYTVMVLCGVVMTMFGAEAAPHAPPLGDRTVTLVLDSKIILPSHPVRPLHDHSISPWTYNTTHYKDLYPPTIHQAHCSLSGCLDKEGRENLTFESKPILHQILVLRRVLGTIGVNYRYRLETMVIPVGCTCVNPSIKVQQ
ncbi:interleukin 17a/f1 [Osmerus mordax]|uniref:interleukin 17a/f1 n=1 Tax=Osmerus mordax TaxID=8014 RepID=UPI00350EADE6